MPKVGAFLYSAGVVGKLSSAKSLLVFGAHDAQRYVLCYIDGEIMIWIMKVELLFGAYANEAWEGTIEIESSSTLEDLHFALQKSLNFDNDHMYEFYVSRTERSHNRTRYDDENGMVYEKTLEKLYPLKKNNKLFYLFDYGDSWTFKLTKSRKKSKASVQGVQYPRLIEEVGIKPEQYPSWE